MSVIVDKINRSGNLANKLCREGSVVNKAYRSGELIYQRTYDSNYYKTEYLTFEILSNGTIVLKTNGNFEGRQIQYSKNGGEWINARFENTGYTISVISGDILRFRGNNAEYFVYGHTNYFSGTAIFLVKGNIMSLVYGDNFNGQTTLTSENTFMSMFSNCYGLTDASELILPATTVTKGCYEDMFDDCINLKKAPSILPSTTLAVECYVRMFYGCSSLTTIPTLPATVLKNKCYYNMLNGCSSLNVITCFAEDITAIECTKGWVSGVSQTGIFVKSTNMSSWTTGEDGIPSGWTVQDNT